MPEIPEGAVPPIRLFYSYAREDEVFRQALDKHLSALKRTGVIAPWHDRRIVPGVDWAHEIDTHLEHAHLILLLVSADFLASDYCWGVEMDRAIAMHRAGLARVVPVMVRPVDIEGVPFASLQALPREAKPITEWRNLDTAWADVAKGIRAAALDVRDRIRTRPDRSGASRLDPAAGDTLYRPAPEAFDIAALASEQVTPRPPAQPPPNTVPVEARHDRIVASSTYPPEAWLEPRGPAVAHLWLNPLVALNDNALRRLSTFFQWQPERPGATYDTIHPAILRWDEVERVGAVTRRGIARPR